ncbi:unnamed protein product [Schistosoma margrebowiei]|uniref:Uncharacterized protein n=1 Tax=Schistosoma margrebowiei TaxID=48269 RepID=A0A183MKT3_9TREM|nr:unnamed protein product [Schistosoma margrebowiei]
MKTSTSEGKHGIQWITQNQLDDLNLALLSQTHEQIQIKTVSVAAVSASVVLNIHARYSTSIGRIPSATAFCVKEQTSFQLKRKLGKDDGNG